MTVFEVMLAWENAYVLHTKRTIIVRMERRDISTPSLVDYNIGCIIVIIVVVVVVVVVCMCEWKSMIHFFWRDVVVSSEMGNNNTVSA